MNPFSLFKLITLILFIAGHELANVSLVSIAGSFRDRLIRSELTDVSWLLPPENGFALITTSIPTVRLQIDHAVPSLPPPSPSSHPKSLQPNSISPFYSFVLPYICSVSYGAIPWLKLLPIPYTISSTKRQVKPR